MGDKRAGPTFLGEFEQMVLLATLQAGDDAFALAVLRELDRRAGRAPGRSLGEFFKPFGEVVRPRTPRRRG